MKISLKSLIKTSLVKVFEIDSFRRIGNALRLIPRKRRRKLFAIVLIQASLSILDLLGIALIGVIGALSVSGIKSSIPSDGIKKVLSIMGIENIVFQKQIAILGISAAIFLILKTVISAGINKRILRFLSSNTSIVSNNLYKRLLNNPSIMLDGNSSQRTLYAITQGVQSLNIGGVGSLMNIIAEMLLLLVLAAGLLFFDTVLALGTVTLFGAGAIILYFALHKRARILGIQYSDLTVSLNDIFIESRNAYREIFVRNQLMLYWEKFRKNRDILGLNVAESAFMPLISKYAIEITLILGALLVTALQFSRENAEQAAASLGIFFATSSRLAPSILRMQQSLISMKIALYESTVTEEFIEDLNNSEQQSLFDESYEEATKQKKHVTFTAEVEVKSITARYKNADDPALKNISFKLPRGSFTAIVGPSGAGKSTLADCILGILEPEEGSVSISGIPPSEAIKFWPGSIAYVPQQSYLARGTIQENVTFNLDYSDDMEKNVFKALDDSNALEFVKELPAGIHTQIGERGSQLSGGQRQRIGIARALYNRPELLVLDEATSALDSISERLITETLAKAQGKCTLIVIAHRLSTVRMANQLIYLESGEMKDMGTFDDLYSRNSRFAILVDAMQI
jgi:ABC-type multidrug transport system fused ATPase/permease subunit